MHSFDDIPRFTDNDPREQAIVCDLDGTLALHVGRNPYDTSKCYEDHVNPVVKKIIRAFEETTQIIFVSARDESSREETVRWLTKKARIYSPMLYLRAEGDFRKDYTIKSEIYRRHIEPYYNVLFVLEDRTRVVDMWRALGLVCLQVKRGDY